MRMVLIRSCRRCRFAFEVLPISIAEKPIVTWLPLIGAMGTGRKSRRVASRRRSSLLVLCCPPVPLDPSGSQTVRDNVVTKTVEDAISLVENLFSSQERSLKLRRPVVPEFY
jgi:hypothetical protein